jgi:hypothetical protein
MTTFEQIQAGLGADVTRRRTSAAAAREAAAEVRQRWQSIFAAIPPAQQKMATLLLSDPRCTLTDAEIVEACNVGVTPPVNDSPLATLSEPSFDSPASRRESELAALAVLETSRLLGKTPPATLPPMPKPIPRAGRGWQVDPALQIAAEALAKRLAPITCQS